MAAAIGSALKKFAPQCDRRLAASLPEAESAAAAINPALVILDLDPPLPGVLAFLERMKTQHPQARVLAIACGTSSEVQTQAGLRSAIRFIEKPFELPHLGDAVRTLLTAADGDDKVGTLRGMNAADLIQLQCVNGASGVVIVESLQGERGEMRFTAGQLRHASASRAHGIGAVSEMLSWDIATFNEAIGAEGAPVNIQGEWSANLLEALRNMKRAQRRTRALSATTSAKREPRRTKNGRKIVVIDDTEMLLIFVEEILSTFDPGAQIVTAHTGTEGFRRSELIVPDLVLLDFDLPDINGDEVCRRLLETKATSRVPIIMMSGHVPEMLATAERFQNVAATISKPFLSQALITLVEKTLAEGPRVISRVPSSLQTAVGETDPRQPAPQKPVKSPAAANGPESAPMATAPAPPEPIESPPMEKRSRVEQNGTGYRPATEPQSSAVAAPAVELPTPPLRSIAAAAERLTPAKPSDVTLVISLEAIAVEFTGLFQIGTIRARVSSPIVALRVPPHSLGRTSSVEQGFDLARVSTGPRGGIETLRLIPTRRRLDAFKTRNRLQIGEIAVTPADSHIQFTATADAAMAFQLLARCEVAAVELSANFEVAHLVLKLCDDQFRVAFDSSRNAEDAPVFTAQSFQLDSTSRLSELLLAPATR